MEIAFAVGAEIEAGGDSCGALRASVGQWFTDKKVDDETNKEVGRGEDEDE